MTTLSDALETSDRLKAVGLEGEELLVSLLCLIKVIKLTLIHTTYVSVQHTAVLIGAREIELNDPHIKELSP